MPEGKQDPHRLFSHMRVQQHLKRLGIGGETLHDVGQPDYQHLRHALDAADRGHADMGKKTEV